MFSILDPNNALAYSGLGRAYWEKYLATKDPTLVETARQACERGLGLDEKESAPHACLGVVESGVGQYEKAVEEFQHALEREPDSDDALLGLAFAYQRLGRQVDAEQTFKRAIALRPRYWAGYSRLGEFYHRVSRFADAEQMFRQVIAILPDSWRGYSNLGAELYVQGKSDAAIAAFEKSWSLRPNYQSASNLGTLVLLRKSRLQEGRRGVQTRADTERQAVCGVGQLRIGTALVGRRVGCARSVYEGRCARRRCPEDRTLAMRIR